MPLAITLAFLAASASAQAALPSRIQRIVLHSLGHPSYDKPALRFRFLSPAETLALWRVGFGAHWIVGTDGTIWPRMGEPYHPRGSLAEGGERERIVREAAPVYAHVFRENADSVGIEVAHSGRSDVPFPKEQLSSLAWLLRSLLALSEGRLTLASIVGHKDRDRRPAFVSDSCERDGCPYFVDGSGDPYRRRVDPPEALFVALAAEGVAVPRPSNGDRDLWRAESIPESIRPEVRK